jgi:hypothetical protein
MSAWRPFRSPKSSHQPFQHLSRWRFEHPRAQRIQTPPNRLVQLLVRVSGLHRPVRRLCSVREQRFLERVECRIELSELQQTIRAERIYGLEIMFVGAVAGEEIGLRWTTAGTVAKQSGIQRCALRQLRCKA